MTDLALPSLPVVDGYASTREPAVGMAGELVGYVLAELPTLAVLDGRDRLHGLAERGLDLLAAGRVQVDLWVRTQQHADAGDARVRHRLWGIGSFYRYRLTHDLVASDPTMGVARPRVDREYTATVSLTRGQGPSAHTAEAVRAVEPWRHRHAVGGRRR